MLILQLITLLPDFLKNDLIETIKEFFINQSVDKSILTNKMYHYFMNIKDQFINKNLNDFTKTMKNNFIYPMNVESFGHTPYPLKATNIKPNMLTEEILESLKINGVYNIPVVHYDRYQINFGMDEKKFNENDFEDYLINTLAFYLIKNPPQFFVPIGYYLYFQKNSPYILQYKEEEIVYGKNKYEILKKLLSRQKNLNKVNSYIKEIFDIDKTKNIPVQIYTEDNKIEQLLYRFDSYSPSNLNKFKNCLRLNIQDEKNIEIVNGGPMVKKFTWEDFKSVDEYSVNSLDERFLDARINMISYLLGIKCIILFKESQMDMTKPTDKTVVFGSEIIIPILCYYDVFMILLKAYSFPLIEKNLIAQGLEDELVGGLTQLIKKSEQKVIIKDVENKLKSKKKDINAEYEKIYIQKMNYYNSLNDPNCFKFM